MDLFVRLNLLLKSRCLSVRLFLFQEVGKVKISDAADFGRAIRRRRKELGYTQGYLSEATGLSVSFISDLERGKTTAELEKAIVLVNLLGLDLELKVRG